jgi:sRNA-binding protein
MNPRIFALGLGIALGYVLGTRAGRERYDQMKNAVTGLWEEPRVAKARADVEAYAKQQAPIIRERAETVAKDVAAKTTATAKDVAAKTAATAKDVASKTSSTAKVVASKVAETATDVAAGASKVAADLRERGEQAVDTAASSVGAVRDAALAAFDDDDDAKDSPSV